MAGIFLNYRRDDSAPYAGRLHDLLTRTFPAHPVFMDVDDVKAGEDFVAATERGVLSSQLVIAVIGPRWATLRDASGRRRLDDPDDFVVRELSAALLGGVTIIPVLVGGATMPGAADLPKALASLARRHAVELSDARFITDAVRLVEACAPELESPPAAAAPPVPPVPRRGWRGRTAVAAVAGAVAAIGLLAVAAVVGANGDTGPGAGEQPPTLGSYLGADLAWQWLSAGSAYCYGFDGRDSCESVEFPLTLGAREITLHQFQFEPDAQAGGGFKVVSIQKLVRGADGSICTTHSEDFIDSLQIYHAADRHPRLGGLDTAIDAGERQAILAERKQTERQLMGTRLCVRFLITAMRGERIVEVEEHDFLDGVRQPGRAPRIRLVEIEDAKASIELRPADS